MVNLINAFLRQFDPDALSFLGTFFGAITAALIASVVSWGVMSRTNRHQRRESYVALRREKLEELSLAVQKRQYLTHSLFQTKSQLSSEEASELDPALLAHPEIIQHLYFPELQEEMGLWLNWQTALFATLPRGVVSPQELKEIRVLQMESASSSGALFDAIRSLADGHAATRRSGFLVALLSAFWGRSTQVGLSRGLKRPVSTGLECHVDQGAFERHAQLT